MRFFLLLVLDFFLISVTYSQISLRYNFSNIRLEAIDGLKLKNYSRQYQVNLFGANYHPAQLDMYPEELTILEPVIKKGTIDLISEGDIMSKYHYRRIVASIDRKINVSNYNIGLNSVQIDGNRILTEQSITLLGKYHVYSKLIRIDKEYADRMFVVALLSENQTIFFIYSFHDQIIQNSSLYREIYNEINSIDFLKDIDIPSKFKVLESESEGFKKFNYYKKLEEAKSLRNSSLGTLNKSEYTYINSIIAFNFFQLKKYTEAKRYDEETAMLYPRVRDNTSCDSISLMRLYDFKHIILSTNTKILSLNFNPNIHNHYTSTKALIEELRYIGYRYIVIMPSEQYLPFLNPMKYPYEYTNDFKNLLKFAESKGLKYISLENQEGRGFYNSIQYNLSKLDQEIYSKNPDAGVLYLTLQYDYQPNFSYYPYMFENVKQFFELKMISVDQMKLFPKIYEQNVATCLNQIVNRSQWPIGVIYNRSNSKYEIYNLMKSDLTTNQYNSIISNKNARYACIFELNDFKINGANATPLHTIEIINGYLGFELPAGMSFHQVIFDQDFNIIEERAID